MITLLCLLSVFMRARHAWSLSVRCRVSVLVGFMSLRCDNSSLNYSMPHDCVTKVSW